MYSTSVAVTSSSNPVTYQFSVTFTATITPSGGGMYPGMSGSVQFFSDGVSIGSGHVGWNGMSNTGSATVTFGPLRAGTRSITAQYSGDSNYSTSTSSAFNQTVNKASPGANLAVSPSSPSVYGQTVALTAEMTSAPVPGIVNPVGTITFTDSSSDLGTGTLAQVAYYESNASLAVSNLSVGSHPLSFSFPGDSNWLSAGPFFPTTYTVDKASTATRLSGSVNPSAACQNVEFAAQVSPVSPASGTPTGDVVFRADGSIFATVALSSGAALATNTWSSAGSHSVTVAYDGDSNFNTSTSSTLTQTVNSPVNWAVTAALPRPIRCKASLSGLGRHRSPCPMAASRAAVRRSMPPFRTSVHVRAAATRMGARQTHSQFLSATAREPSTSSRSSTRRWPAISAPACRARSRPS